MTNDNEKMFLGALPDPRTQTEKDQDYHAEELMALATVVPWTERDPSEWRTFGVRSQDGSGTCVAQTGAKLLGAENVLEEPNAPFITFSATDIYDRRVNKPQAGMWGVDALSIVSKFGAASDDMIPSQNLNEAQCNVPIIRTPEQIAFAEKYRAGGYVQVPMNIDAVASVINLTKKAVMIFVSFEYDEWIDTPQIKYDHEGSLRHSITAADFAVYKGKKGLIIDDSWGRFNAWRGQRFVSEDFLRERLFFAGNLLDLSNNHQEKKPDRPYFKFTRPLIFNSTGQDVINLQNMLKYEQFFPQAQISTGLFWQVTAKGVRKWQMAHGIFDFQNEKDITKIRFGAKSIEMANKLYA